MTSTKIEFDVQMTCGKCVDVIDQALKEKGIETLDIDLSKESVVVTTSLPTEQVRKIIEDTGRRAVVKGLGSALSNSHLGAAVSMIDTGLVRGVIRMVQQSEQECLFDGTVDGLTAGQAYQVNVHELGDLSEGCASCGDIYAGLDGANRNSGKLGEVTADESGRLTFRMTSPDLKVWEMIGRSMVISSKDERLGCGIVARSAGLFENSKRICACDGVSVWDERDVPLAGDGRKIHANQ